MVDRKKLTELCQGAAVSPVTPASSSPPLPSAQCSEINTNQKYTEIKL